MIFRHLPKLLLAFVLSVSSFLLAQIVLGQTVPNTRHHTRMPIAKGQDAKKLFRQKCVKCHGRDGTGETTLGQIMGATDLTDSKWQERVSDQRVVISMTYGRGEMPSFGKKLSKEQINILLAYVRAFKR